MAFAWVRRLAAVLANKKWLDAAAVRRRYRGVIAALARHRGKLGTLTEAFDHFHKVTRSYWPGLFRCYDVAALPRTNNDLEQFFGSYRYHERRASGREVACPGTVVRGSVRLVASAATRLRPVEGSDLVPSDVSRWREPCAAAWSGVRAFGHWAVGSAGTVATSSREGLPHQSNFATPSFFG